MEDGIAMVIFTGITIGRRGIIIGIIYIYTVADREIEYEKFLVHR
jgi:hypothetical protein